MPNRMMVVLWCVTGLIGCASVGRAFSAESKLAGRRPNIIVILTDDQGYGDISAHGNPLLKTPQLDRMRSLSLRFTDFHVSPTCAPTRSALMTGRHEFRNGITHTVLERERLTLQATTVAEVLSGAGYATGIFGKWHLGDEAEYQPGRRGFQETFIHGAGGIGQSYEGSCGDAPGNRYTDPYILHNGQFEKTRGYCTDVFFERATAWMDERRQSSEPFFCWIATNAPHSPYIARPQDFELYRETAPSPEIAQYFGMIHNIDQNVGRLIDRLKDWGIDHQTLVIFMNDNGGTAGVPVYNARMRGQKGTAWLGGTRASSFWFWPGTLRGADCRALAAHIDLFPTLAELAGVRMDDRLAEQVEGRSLAGLLSDPQGAWPDRTLFTHVGRWPSGADRPEYRYAQCSVRTARWHLVSADGGREPRWELFDVSADYGEQHDVAAEHPEVVRDLASRMDTWWDDVQPQLVNEDAVGPAENAYHRLFWSQFGRGDAGGKAEGP
ncbi:MAG: arylsulfatase [Pirellulales bacterium]